MSAVVLCAHPILRTPTPAKRPQVRLHKIFKLYNSDLEREMRCKMKNGLGRNVNGPTRPIGHPPQIRKCDCTKYIILIWRGKCGVN